jgi:hypothetical protein
MHVCQVLAIGILQSRKDFKLGADEYELIVTIFDGSFLNSKPAVALPAFGFCWPFPRQAPSVKIKNSFGSHRRTNRGNWDTKPRKRYSYHTQVRNLVAACSLSPRDTYRDHAASRFEKKRGRCKKAAYGFCSGL